MRPKLDIATIEWKNFGSYGNYVTKIDLTGTGPVLIVGKLIENNDSNEQKVGSNGAGKSTIGRAILWCLFGLIGSKNKPGDAVINWLVGEKCFVRITTADGYEIIRTRKYSGHNDLLIKKDGVDESTSINDEAQKQINRTFGLDYDIFTTSVFCGQRDSLMAMADVKRKETMEKLFIQDKINTWAAAAKEKKQKVENKLDSLRFKQQNLKEENERLDDKIKKNKEDFERFENERIDKLVFMEEESFRLNEEGDALIAPDLDSLRDKWNLIGQINDKIYKWNGEKDSLYNKIETLEHKISSNHSHIVHFQSLEKPVDLSDIQDQWDKYSTAFELKDNIVEKINKIKIEKVGYEGQRQLCVDSIDKWKNAPTTCVTCGQEVDTYDIKIDIGKWETSIELWDKGINKLEEDISKLQIGLAGIVLVRPNETIEGVQKATDAYKKRTDRIQELEEDNDNNRSTIAEHKERIEKIEKMVSLALEQTDQHKPSMTLTNAEEIHSRAREIVKELESLKHQSEALQVADNPYSVIDSTFNESVTLNLERIAGFEEDVAEANKLIKHMIYIHTAYHDRRKIKRFLLSTLIPFLNKKIKHYLDLFGSKYQLEFTPTLAIKASKGSYLSWSGGEKKRVDMSIMFAIHDLYTVMYGKQCNVMVLDEVDEKLDPEGASVFADIIINEFAKADKPSSRLVISHNAVMGSMFPSQMEVVMRGGFSHIVSQR